MHFLLIIRRFSGKRFYRQFVESEKEEIYNSDRDRFSDRSLYDQLILVRFVAFKWDILVHSERPTHVYPFKLCTYMKIIYNCT